MQKKRRGRPRAAATESNDPAADILTAARALVREHGITATTTRMIAERAGLRQPSLFHHFANKQDIIRTIAAKALAPELEFIEAEQSRAHSPEVALYRFARFVADNLASNPNVLGSPARFPELLTEDYRGFQAGYETILDYIERLMVDGIAAGAFIDTPPAETASALMALLETALHQTNAPSPSTAATLALRAVLIDPNALAALQRTTES